VSRVAGREAAVLAFATTMAFIGSMAAPSADVAPVSSAVEIPCAAQANGVQGCVGVTVHRVHSRELPGT
jgi:hypothetical protein